MTDTIRSQSYLTSNLFQDGQPPGSITPQSVRDFIVSAFGSYSTTHTADYTAQLTDQGTTVSMSAASGVTFAVPDNASVDFPVGAVIEVRQTGAGQVRAVPGTTDVSLHSATGAFSTRAQWSKIRLTQESTNSWVVDGDVSEPPRFMMGDQSGFMWASNDGQTWASNFLIASPPGSSGTDNITWVPELGIYAAVDSTGSYHYTSDGINWSTISINPGVELDSIAYHNGVFVIAGLGNNGNIATFYSLDGGITWQANTPIPGVANTLASMVNTAGLFIGGSYSDNGFLFTSPDGRTWTQNAFSTGNFTDVVESISYNPLTGRYIACITDSNSVLSGRVYTSDNGLNWNVSGTALTGEVSGLGAIGNRDSIFADGMFFVGTGSFTQSGNGAVSGVTGAGHVFYSNDNATTWHDIGDVTQKGYGLIELGQSGSIYVAVDADGNVYRALSSVVTSVSGWLPVGNITGPGVTVYALASRP